MSNCLANPAESCKICPINQMCQATTEEQCIETLQLIIETYNEKLGSIRGFIDDLDGSVSEIEAVLDEWDTGDLDALTDRWEEENMEENSDERDGTGSPV